MILLVIWLFVEIQRSVRREKRTGFAATTLQKERCAYAVISIFFGLSYIGRFALDKKYDGCIEISGDGFVSRLMFLFVYLFEGVSLGVLMVFHLINFKYRSRTLTSEQPYISIFPGEYYYFTDAELDAESLDEDDVRSFGDYEDLEVEVDNNLNSQVSDADNR